MVHMPVPRERDERVDVEKGLQSSSSARRTISGVIGGASEGDMMIGKRPVVSMRAGVNPRRASSEMTAPRDLRPSAASSRAAVMTSSSISSVVRIA
jgi:hypothetical protein